MNLNIKSVVLAVWLWPLALTYAFQSARLLFGYQLNSVVNVALIFSGMLALAGIVVLRRFSVDLIALLFFFVLLSSITIFFISSGSVLHQAYTIMQIVSCALVYTLFSKGNLYLYKYLTSVTRPLFWLISFGIISGLVLKYLFGFKAYLSFGGVLFILPFIFLSRSGSVLVFLLQVFGGKVGVLISMFWISILKFKSSGMLLVISGALAAIALSEFSVIGKISSYYYSFQTFSQDSLGRMGEVFSSYQLIKSSTWLDLVFGAGFFNGLTVPAADGMKLVYTAHITPLSLFVFQGIVGSFFWFYVFFDVSFRCFRSQGQSRILLLCCLGFLIFSTTAYVFFNNLVFWALYAESRRYS